MTETTNNYRKARMTEALQDTRKNAPETRVIGRPFEAGNPGRPKGSRNKLGEDFLKALHEDFVENGKSAIAECREKKPDAYLKVICMTLPKQAEITINEYDRMDSNQLRGALTAALRDLATFGIDTGFGSGESPSQTTAGEPASPLSPVH